MPMRKLMIAGLAIEFLCGIRAVQFYIRNPQG